MPIDAAVVASADEVPPRQVAQGAFVYEKRLLVPKTGNQATVAFMEIPPGHSAFPYHWHESITEMFVILAGEGRLRTPTGERIVVVGDVVILPPGPAGAHRLTNDGTLPLRYVDIDTTADPDVVHYPDSGKTGMVVGGVPAAVFRDADAVDYYDGEVDAGED